MCCFLNRRCRQNNFGCCVSICCNNQTWQTNNATAFNNNFAIDRSVSASFFHTSNYHHIAEIGFL